MNANDSRGMINDSRNPDNSGKYFAFVRGAQIRDRREYKND